MTFQPKTFLSLNHTLATDSLMFSTIKRNIIFITDSCHCIKANIMSRRLISTIWIPKSNNNVHNYPHVIEITFFIIIGFCRKSKYHSVDFLLKMRENTIMNRLMIEGDENGRTYYVTR